MKKVYNKITNSKLCLLLALGWLALSSSSCTFSYYTPDGGTFTGTTTYCEGATATANTLNYTECSTGLGIFSSGVACTVQWYYNTTGGTSIITSTTLGAPIGFTSSSSGFGSLNYVPLTTTPGTFYYFAYITWGTGYCISPFTSGTQAVTINPPPGPITGPSSVCIGSTIPLSVPGGGGTWVSGTTGVATVTTAGVVTGVSSGTSLISYTATGCGAPATFTVTVDVPPASITGPTNVCVGSTVTLADATGGTWSSSAPTIASIDPGTGIVSGVAQGTATITFTSTSTCTTTAPMAVNGPPGPIAGPTTVCQGSTITMTDPATGGNWSSSSLTIATTTFSSGIVTGVSPGTSLITYSNGCGPATAATVTVNPLPDTITGSLGVCMGAIDSLADATSGGTWSSTITAIATIASTGVAYGASAGMTTISYTIANGCAATISLTVIPPLSPITGANQVCQGLTTTLGASPLGGTWTSGNPAIATVGPSSGIVSGITMGTSVITYTAGVGCSATHLITVNPMAPILGQDSVCQGLSTFLTNIVGGGHWTSTYPATAIVDPDSGRVTGITPGTTVIYYLIPATGCQSSVTFSVIAFPDAITGTTKACPGTTTALADATAGGLWTSSNPGIATVGPTNGTVTGVSADTVTVNYTILPGCAANTTVTINPLPDVITGALIICPGTIDSLTDLTTGGLWSTTTPSLATVIDTSGVVTAISGGSPIIVYTLPTGCLRTKTLSVNPVPVPVVTYNSGTSTFYTPNIYVSYQWYDSIQGMITGATSPSVAALYKEYYWVVVTDTNGCKGASALYHFDPASAGVNTAGGKGRIKIYPNPTSGVLYIQSDEKVRAVVNGVDGKKDVDQPDAKEIDISKLANGTYFITLYNDNNEVLTKQKFIKE